MHGCKNHATDDRRPYSTLFVDFRVRSRDIERAGIVQAKRDADNEVSDDEVYDHFPSVRSTRRRKKQLLTVIAATQIIIHPSQSEQDRRLDPGANKIVNHKHNGQRSQKKSTGAEWCHPT